MDVPNEVNQEHDSFCLIEISIVHLLGLWPLSFSLVTAIKGKALPFPLLLR